METSCPSIVLLLRGHERMALKNKKLYNFVRELTQLFTVRIYIHSWNISEARTSWRDLPKKRYDIHDSVFLSYFEGLIGVSIIKIKIESDINIKLYGNIDGFISKLPKIAWKRMWYGQYNAMKQIKEIEDSKSMVLNMRIDYFDCESTLEYKITTQMILEKLKQECEENNVRFMHELEVYKGVDNLMFGPVKYMYTLIYHFNYNLDWIVSLYPYIICQEAMVFLETDRLFKGGKLKTDLEYFMTSFSVFVDDILSKSN